LLHLLTLHGWLHRIHRCHWSTGGFDWGRGLRSLNERLSRLRTTEGTRWNLWRLLLLLLLLLRLLTSTTGWLSLTG
jgi:hypothetical protein